MRINKLTVALSLVTTMLLTACNEPEVKKPAEKKPAVGQEMPVIKVKSQTTKQADEYSRFDIYAPFTLTSDLSHLSTNQKQIIGLLIDAGHIMDKLFWQVAYGDQDKLLSSIDDPKARQFAIINYGPWDRLAANKPFIEGAVAKSPGLPTIQRI